MGDENIWQLLWRGLPPYLDMVLNIFSSGWIPASLVKLLDVTFEKHFAFGYSTWQTHFK